MLTLIYFYKFLLNFRWERHIKLGYFESEDYDSVMKNINFKNAKRSTLNRVVVNAKHRHIKMGNPAVEYQIKTSKVVGDF